LIFDIIINYWSLFKGKLKNQIGFGLRLLKRLKKTEGDVDVEGLVMVRVM
jgi:hypothetical protein